MDGLLAILAVAGAALAVPYLLQRWRDARLNRARRDPSVDPAAEVIDDDARGVFAARVALLAPGPGPTGGDDALAEAWRLLDASEEPDHDAAAALFASVLRADGANASARAGVAASAMAACHVGDGWYWRGGLRQLLPVLEPLEDLDARAVLGQVLAHLGELDRAFAVLDTLPADHWRGCLARSVAYAARGDEERALSALNAAAELGLTRPRPHRSGAEPG